MKRREFLYGVGAVGAVGISYRFAPASVTRLQVSLE